MPLQVVGAGLGRTGTSSLQLALQQLLGGGCYHMLEVFTHPEHIPLWHAAVRDEGPRQWDEIFADYVAAVDWPVVTFWRELADVYPDAKVLLSLRSADSWWKSASSTIFEIGRREVPESEPVFAAQHRMVLDMFERFTPDWREEGPAKAAFDAHNEAVRASVPPERLTVWEPGDGWEPLCQMLDVPVPNEPFPHVNSTDDFRAMLGLA